MSGERVSDESPREDLSPWFVPLFELEAPLDWTAFFPRSGPVELDVGSGRGRFTNEAATTRPGVNFCGVEHDFTAARRGCRRLKRDAAPNARVVGGDAMRFLDQFVPPGSVAAIHVLYPDPWWKRRHRKRRLLGEDLGDRFLDLILRALEPAGRLHVRTDVGEYFSQIVDRLDGDARLARRPDPLDETAAAILAAAPDTPLTNYERKAVVGPDRPDFQTDGVTHAGVWDVRPKPEASARDAAQAARASSQSARTARRTGAFRPVPR